MLKVYKVDKVVKTVQMVKVVVCFMDYIHFNWQKSKNGLKYKKPLEEKWEVGKVGSYPQKMWIKCG